MTSLASRGSSSLARRGGRGERPSNTGSILISSTENHALFTQLGADCISLAAGVVQLLHAPANGTRVWSRMYTGVVSLVKDYEKRAYFLRLYDVNGHHSSCLWEQMLYKGFRVKRPCEELLTFEGDNDVFGLNFSSRDEATGFRHHLDKRYEQEQRTQAKENRPSPSTTNGATPGVHSRSVAPSLSSGAGAGITSVGTLVHLSNSPSASAHARKEKKVKKKEKKPRIRKEDISNPTNFQHKAHIGWDQDGGFCQQVFDQEPMDESVKALLRAAGQNPDKMHPDEIAFTYQFLSEYKDEGTGGHAQSQQSSRSAGQWSSQERSAAPAPPPPHRRDAAQHPPPPPPPPLPQVQGESVRAAPPRPPVAPAAGGRPPARPLPQPPATPSSLSRPADVPPPPPPPPPPSMANNASHSGAPPPPPPPPPPVSNGGAAQAGGRGNLLAEIHAGRSLRPIATSQAASGENNNGEARGTVMAQIRQGAQLKHVDKSVEQRKSTTEMGGIAGALARALEERRKNMRNSEESSDDDGGENNDSEWEED